MANDSDLNWKSTNTKEQNDLNQLVKAADYASSQRYSKMAQNHYKKYLNSPIGKIHSKCKKTISKGKNFINKYIIGKPGKVVTKKR